MSVPNGSTRLKGKVIVVAGAGAGTGEATALRLGAEGARVVVGDLHDDRAANVAGRIKAAGGEAISMAFDMSQPETITELITYGAKTFGRLDGLHNIAGNPRALADDHDLLETSTQTWLSQMQNHLLGYAHGAKIAIPFMLESGGGTIVNTSSAAARSASPTQVAYQSAKSAMETMTRHIASRYGKDGIRCNAIAYGLVLTAKADALMPQAFKDQSLASSWSRRHGRPEDIAGLAAFLLSDEGEWLNGQIIDMNGGRLLGP